MAETLENIRDDILKSIHGRQLGLTHNGHLGGFKDVRRVVTNATSDTTGTALLPYGLHSIVTTTDDSWILTDPEWAGSEVKLVTNSSSTGTHTVTCDNANILTTSGSSFISADFNAEGEALILAALTTALWAVVSNVNGVVFTT